MVDDYRRLYKGPYKRNTEEYYAKKILDSLEKPESWMQPKPILDEQVVSQIVVEEKKITRIRELRKTMMKEQSVELEPLKLFGSKVIGELFDRVNFLRERINEIQTAISERQLLNEKFISNIDEDIEDKQKMLALFSDKDIRREIKLDVTLLNMEKRKESTTFWRDVLTLKKELRELLEQYQVESKIASLFRNLK